MSVFSGKCDFYDSVVSIHCDGDPSKLEEFFANTEIRIMGRDGREHKLDIKTEKDAVKYYPYLKSVACFTKEKGNTILLASRPFIDYEEEQHMGWHIEDAKKYWRKCKRNKEECTVEKYFANSYWGDRSEYIDRPIMEELIKNGNKADFKSLNLHDELHEHFRRKWFAEMVRVGYTEIEAFNWCFDEFYPDDKVIIKRLGRPLKVEE